jgi:hypothetical protein
MSRPCPGLAGLQVGLATTLFNRLRITQPTAYTGARQNYGLLGPVRLIPRT